MPVPHHSVFTGRMPFLPPSQQRQSTEGIFCYLLVYFFSTLALLVGRLAVDKNRFQLFSQVLFEGPGPVWSNSGKEVWLMKT